MLYSTYTLLAILLLSRTAHSITPVILFTQQSQNILFQDWFNYITLCFAPLIAHVIAGVASPTVINPHAKEPTWSALLSHFNPISIVWRWYAIADRRLRAYSWDAIDMVACNAVFWNTENARWDGSEEIMVRSRAWITRTPRLSHVSLVSTSGLTTVILTLQGTRACFLIFASLNPKTTYGFAQGLPSVFLPLGCLGLMRLPAALWLSDDHIYLEVPETDSYSAQNVGEPSAAIVEEVGGSLCELDPLTSNRAVATAAVTPPFTTHSHLSELTTSIRPRLHSKNTRIAFLYRIWWFISIIGLVGGSAMSTLSFSWSHSPYMSLSGLLFNVLYFILTTATVLITCTYILLGRTQSTLIPCIHATWYKVFTVVLIVMAVVTTIVTALETRQLLDGSLTTLPEFQCNTTAGLCVPVSRGHGNSNI